MLKACAMEITPAERERFEVADFGLGELLKTGLEVLTYVNTERVCAKEIVMFPHQTCPSFCTTRSERVYIAAPGCETGRLGVTRGL